MFWYLAMLVCLAFWAWLAANLVAARNRIPLLKDIDPLFVAPKKEEMRKVDGVPTYEFQRDKDMVPGVPWISVIVPARNEQESIRNCLESILEQDYPNFEVIVVDDRSTDHTGNIVDYIANHSHGRCRAIHISELPEGWLGKCHALATGARKATGTYVLFTDGDVQFEPTTLNRVMRSVTNEQADMLVVVPHTQLHTFWEKVMMLAFVEIFMAACPPWLVMQPQSKRFIGIGAFNLAKRSLYEKIGGHEQLRLQAVDDVGLGKLLKQAGAKVRMVVGLDMVKVRWQESFSGMVRGMEKNAFAAMGYNAAKLIGAVALLVFVNWWPWYGMFHGPGFARFLCAMAAIFGQSILGIALSQMMEISPFYGYTVPAGSLVIGWTFLRSMFVTLRQGGIFWRDTFYPLKELRRFRI